MFVKMFAYAAVAMMATACDDNIAGTLATDDATISFRVATIDRSAGSRAATPASTNQVTPMVSAPADTLYLVANVAHTSSVSRQGRAVAVTSGSISSFGVFATMSGDPSGSLYMDNVEVLRENQWAPSQEYLWPGSGSLEFTAYSPFAATPASEGITSLPAVDADGQMTLSFVTPADVADQFDLMRAIPVTASSSPCAIEFEHALTGVRFAAGSKLTPCHVDKIELVSIASDATLNLTDGTWSDLSTPKSYAITPHCDLAAADGSKYVAPGTAISSDEQTFMFIPQTLADTAALKLTITLPSGSQSEFTATLAGTVWEKGKTVTYNISADPATASLSIEIVDANGNRLDSIPAPYTGADFHYTVRSLYSDGTGSEATPIEWNAVILDDKSNVLDTLPRWIQSFATSGTGLDTCTLTTRMPDPIFLSLSEHSRVLRNTTDINTTSGHTPYNLSSTTGDASVVNTANSYIINAPGHYSLPLVYGNAIKGGATNTTAYVSTITSTTTHNKKALLHFVNHLGNPISDPYIYNNSGCTPAKAALLWEDRLNLVSNVALSDDNHSITFDIRPESIRQGNALIAVEDADGKIMWSWYIWVTDYKLADGWIEIADASGTETQISTVPLGRIYAGDKAEFRRQHARVRFTQANVPAGMEPASVEMVIAQEGKIVSIGDCYTYFQWGRKDPMISGLDAYYDASHHEMDGVSIPHETPGADHKQLIINSILNPQLFMAGEDAALTPMKRSGVFYQNLWDINRIDPSANGPYTSNVKTVYDPSPYGAKVSVGNVFLAFKDLTGTYSQADKTLTFDLPSGETYTIDLLGYRSGRSTSVTNGSGESWTAIARDPTMAVYSSFATSGSVSPQRGNMLYGYSVVPVADL